MVEELLHDQARYNQIGVILDNQRVSLDARGSAATNSEHRIFEAAVMLYGEVGELRAAVVELESRLEDMRLGNDLWTGR
jgi:hypothetical protein